MTFRQLTTAPGTMQEAVTFLTWIRDRLNEEHGGHFGVSANVGTDPSALAIASGWQSLGEYETARASLMADTQIQSAIRMASGLFTSAQDSIGRVMRAPGERGAIANVNTANMHMPAMADAVAFALEVAEYVSSNYDSEVGVMTSLTGNRSGIMFLQYGESMDELAKLGETLEADEEYLAFFKRSEGLIVDGSLEQAMWQLL